MPNQKDKICVIIVSYNGEKFLTNCLSSLLNQDYLNYEIIVIDNNSSDNSVNLIKQSFPRVITIQNKNNAGFAKANNQALRRALSTGSRYFVLLNQDTVADKNFISEGIKAVSGPGIGMACPKIKYLGTNYIWWAGSRLLNSSSNFFTPSIKISEHIGKREEDKGQFDQEKYVDCSTGCALFIKKEVIDKIGLLDENFFMYGEDIDWSLRAAKAGFKILYFPSATVWHAIPLSDNSQPGLKFLFLKYKNYFKAMFLLVTKHYNTGHKFLWFAKLPFILPLVLLNQLLLLFSKDNTNKR